MINNVLTPEELELVAEIDALLKHYTEQAGISPDMSISDIASHGTASPQVRLIAKECIALEKMKMSIFHNRTQVTMNVSADDLQKVIDGFPKDTERLTKTIKHDQKLRRHK